VNESKESNWRRGGEEWYLPSHLESSMVVPDVCIIRTDQ